MTVQASNPAQVAQTYFDQGNAAMQAQQFAQAVACYAHAVELLPNHGGARAHLAMALRSAGDVDAALNHALEAIRLDPSYAKGYLEASMAHWLLGDLSKSLAVLQQAVDMGIHHPQVNTQRASLLAQMGHTETAFQIIKASTQAFPQDVKGWLDLGSLAIAGGHWPEAHEALHTALKLAPNHAPIHHALGLLALQQGQWPVAHQYFQTAVAQDPKNADFQVSMAQWQLQHGQFTLGWAGYEWRLKREAHHGAQDFDETRRWHGEALETRTLLLHCEQGLGDTLQWIRFVQPLTLKHPQAQIVVQAPASLLTLLQASALPVSQWLDETAPLPEYDVHLPLMSLPHVGPWPQPADWPSAPYLSPPTDLMMHFKQRLRALGEGPKVGLAWTGRSTHGFNSQRSLDRAALDHLFNLKGVHWVSLQPGHTLPTALPTHWHDWTDSLRDFAQTAALIESLDAVVTIDTSVAHVAGALGKPVLLLLDFCPDWRWGVETATTPWYPRTTLFRQPAPGQWQPVISQVHTHLAQHYPNLEVLSMPVAPASTGLKLNMGCGQNPKPGYLNVDKYGSPDLQCDLEVFPWPWADNSVCEMVFNHVLEHLGETSAIYLGIFQEIYRVCEAGALVHIVVPHPRHDDFLTDPTHVRAVTVEGLRMLSKAANQHWKDNGYANTTLALYLGIDFEIVEAQQVPAEPWRSQLASGQITADELSEAARRYNNVIKETRVTLKVCK